MTRGMGLNPRMIEGFWNWYPSHGNINLPQRVIKVASQQCQDTPHHNTHFSLLCQNANNTWQSIYLDTVGWLIQFPVSSLLSSYWIREPTQRIQMTTIFNCPFFQSTDTVSLRIMIGFMSWLLVWRQLPRNGILVPNDIYILGSSLSFLHAIYSVLFHSVLSWTIMYDQQKHPLSWSGVLHGVGNYYGVSSQWINQHRPFANEIMGPLLRQMKHQYRAITMNTHLAYHDNGS